MMHAILTTPDPMSFPTIAILAAAVALTLGPDHAITRTGRPDDTIRQVL
jgi:hypothetical protein